ncbi:MAG: hypothetical protein V1744_01935 [Candidatus Altiarchaeota archaeon]
MDFLKGAKLELLHLQAENSLKKGDFRSALKHYEELFSMSLDGAGEASVAYYLERIGDCYDNLDHHGHKERIEDHRKAAENYVKSADRYRKLRNHEKAGEIYEKGAKAYEEVDDFTSAAEFYKESATMFSEVRDYVNASYAYNTAARYYEKDGKFDDAAKNYQESAICDMRIKDTASAATSFKKAAQTYENAKNWAKAIDAYAGSVEIDLINRHYLDVADTYDRMADCYYETNDQKNAVYYHIKSAELKDANSDKNGAGLSYRKVGTIYENAGEYDHSIEYFLKSAKNYYGASSFQQEGASYMNAGRVYELKGDFEKAGDSYLEAGKSNRVGRNEPLAEEGFLKAAQSYSKAAEKTEDKVKSAELNMKAALAYSEIKSYERSADSYNKYAELMSAAGDKVHADEGFRKAAEEYVKGGKIWGAAEAYVNHEDYKRASELYDAHANERAAKKDNFGAANSYMEAGNCYRRLGNEAVMKARLERAVYYFTKFIEETKDKDKSEKAMLLLGDSFRKIGECNKTLAELMDAQRHLTKAEEYYLKANDADRLNLARALRLKVDGVKAIDHGYYPQAEELLRESQTLLDASIKSGAWKREYAKILAEGLEEAKELVEKIKLKPEVVLDVDRYSYTFLNIPVILNLTLSNNGKYTMKDVTFLEHLPEEIKLTKLPEHMPEIVSGGVKSSSIELNPAKTGLHMLKPVEVYYEDQKGHKYVKASNEVVLEVVERPPTDYKNYASALEIFRKYAQSQESNKNWFQAGDGYRQMAVTYGRFRTDETLTGYLTKSVENYRKYVEAYRNLGETDDKTRVKRLADANWFAAEGLRNLNQMDDSIRHYDESIPLYRRGKMENLANRSAALKLKSEGVKAIRLGDYGKAEGKLNEALVYIGEVIKAGGYDTDGLEFLKKNEDETRKMIETVKAKPEINVIVSAPKSAQQGETVTMKATITNPLAQDVLSVRPMVKTVEGVEVVENAKPVGGLKAGGSADTEFRVRFNKTGQYTFSPLDVTYNDDKGNAFMRGSAELTVDVREESEEIRQTVQETKPDINIDLDTYSYTFINIPVILNIKLSNSGAYAMRKVTFLEHLPEGIKLTKLPEGVAEIEPNGIRLSSIELTPSKTGMYTIKPIEVYYEDLKGSKYVKASNQTTLEVVERPPADYKNYMNAVEIFKRYAQSQESNRNWFQAGDGYRQIAGTYGRFRSDDTLMGYHSKSIENYRKYVESSKPEEAEDKTKIKRQADAYWFAAEAHRSLNQLDDSVRAYDESIILYQHGGMDNLGNRSKALKLKAEGVKAIRLGMYEKAGEKLNESLAHINEVIKAGGYDADGLEFLKKNEDEAKKMLETLLTKPEISVVVEAPRTCQVGDPVTLKATVTNPLSYGITGVRSIVKTVEGVEVVENGKPVDRIDAGKNAATEFKIRFNKAGQYTFSSLDVTYNDDKGKSYMVGSNETKISVGDSAQTRIIRPLGDFGKPSLSLDFGVEAKVKALVETEITGVVSNDGTVDVLGVRFIGNNTDDVEVLEAPKEIGSLTAGERMEVKAKIKALKTGTFQFNPFEFFYKDKQGKRFFKGSNQLTVNAQEAEAKKIQQARASSEAEEARLVDIRGRLDAILTTLADNSVVLISSDLEKHSQVTTNTLDILINQKRMGGVYISVSRPCEVILSELKAEGVPAENIRFIDCISLMAGKSRGKEIENAVFIENPSSLEEISMYLDNMLSKVKTQRKFIILDSLDSALIYNTDKSVREFTHFIINRIRLEKITGVILAMEKKEAEDIVRTVASMCDTVIKL